MSAIVEVTIEVGSNTDIGSIPPSFRIIRQLKLYTGASTRTSLNITRPSPGVPGISNFLRMES